MYIIALNIYHFVHFKPSSQNICTSCIPNCTIFKSKISCKKITGYQPWISCGHVQIVEMRNKKVEFMLENNYQIGGGLWGSPSMTFI